MTIRTLSSTEKATLLPVDQLNEVDNLIKHELLTAFDQLTWFPYDGTEVCVANEVVEIRGASSNHFIKYRTKKLTDYQKGSGSELPGVYKIEGAYTINLLRNELALSITYADDLIKPRTSTLYLLNWDGFYDYAVYGNDDYSKLWTNLSKRSIGKVTQEAVADLTSQPPSALDAVEGIVRALREQDNKIGVNTSEITFLKQENKELKSTLAFVQEELSQEREARAALSAQVDPLILKASYISISDLCVETSTVATANAKRVLANSIKKDCLDNSIHYNKFPNTSRPNEYPKDILKKHLKICRDTKAILCKKDENDIWQLWTAADTNPFKATCERTNHYQGLLITRAMVFKMIDGGFFLKGYNTTHQTNYNKFNMWEQVLYPKIEEFIALNGVQISCKKVKELANESCLALLETQCRLPDMYKWLLPYSNKGKELLVVQSKPSFDSKARLGQIKALEREKFNS